MTAPSSADTDDSPRSPPAEDRRHPQGASLRRLFDEQWRQLLERWQAFRQGLDDGTRTTARLAVESIVDDTDPRLRALNGYHRRLAASVRVLLEHVDGIITAMPPALKVDPREFTTRPELRAFFATPADIKRLYEDDPQLQAFLSAAAHPRLKEAFVLLSMRATFKSRFGPQLDSGRLLMDAPLTLIDFSGHRLDLPSSSEARLREALKKYLFDHYVAYVRRNMSANIRAEREKRAYRPASPQSIENPEIYLQHLNRLLEASRTLFRLEDRLLYVSRTGVLVHEDSEQPYDPLTLHEIGIEHEPRTVLVLTRYEHVPRSVPDPGEGESVA